MTENDLTEEKTLTIWKNHRQTLQAYMMTERSIIDAVLGKTAPDKRIYSCYKDSLEFSLTRIYTYKTLCLLGEAMGLLTAKESREAHKYVIDARESLTWRLDHYFDELGKVRREYSKEED